MLHLGCSYSSAVCCAGLVRFGAGSKNRADSTVVIQLLRSRAQTAGAVRGADGLTRSSPRCSTEPDPRSPPLRSARAEPEPDIFMRQPAFQMVGIIPQNRPIIFTRYD